MTSESDRGLLSRWDDVRFLLAVLRSGSFTRAAARLDTDQSTVSRRIGALESQLGLPLFERGQRAPVATQAALDLREAAERIEAEIGRFADTVAGVRSQKVTGRVRLALTEELATEFVVPTVLPALRDAYPELGIDLVTSYRAADLASHEADVALRFFKPTRGDLVGRRLAQFSTAILCARGQRRRLKSKRLDQLDWIAVEIGGLAVAETTWLRTEIGSSPVITCSSYQVQLSAIRSGLGVGIGPAVFSEMSEDFGILEHPDLSLPRLEIFAVTRQAIRKLPRIAVVMDALVDAFAR